MTGTVTVGSRPEVRPIVNEDAIDIGKTITWTCSYSSIIWKRAYDHYVDKSILNEINKISVAFYKNVVHSVNTQTILHILLLYRLHSSGFIQYRPREFCFGRTLKPRHFGCDAITRTILHIFILYLAYWIGIMWGRLLLFWTRLHWAFESNEQFWCLTVCTQVGLIQYTQSKCLCLWKDPEASALLMWRNNSNDS